MQAQIPHPPNLHHRGTAAMPMEGRAPASNSSMQLGQRPVGITRMMVHTDGEW